MATLLDSYSETNVNNAVNIVQGAGVLNQWAGQSWKTPNDGKTYKITSSKFYLKKVGSPAGTYTFKLYANSGTFGTSSIPGTLLATSASANSADLTTSYQLIELAFSGAQQYGMATNTAYVIEIDGTSVTGNSSNYIVIGEADPGGAAGNDNATDNNSAQNSTPSATRDIAFYVYGNEYTIYTMQTAPASFSYTTQSSGDPVNRFMPISPASYVYTTIGAGFKRVFNLITSPASYILTGLSSTITKITPVIYTMITAPAVFIYQTLPIDFRLTIQNQLTRLTQWLALRKIK